MRICEAITLAIFLVKSLNSQLKNLKIDCEVYKSKDKIKVLHDVFVIVVSVPTRFRHSLEIKYIHDRF